MLNSNFNKDFNFTGNQVDIGNVNSLAEDKKQKNIKEATKYDIDRDEHARALNMHNLGTTPRFLPLFTRKVANHRVIKNAP
jgi:hypothetical protein